MSDYRRRRLQPDEPKGRGGLPIFPLIVLVVFAGLLLGGILAKFLGGRGAPVTVASSAPTFTPLPTEAASPTPEATQLAKASPSPEPSPSKTPRETPTPGATASPSPKVTATPHAAATATAAATSTAATATPVVATPKPAVQATRVPTPQPTATPSPSPALITGPATSDHAAAIVRSYLTALANGESSFATGYLQSGLPTEDFMKGGHVTQVQATPNGDGSFFVTAQMTAPGGTYTENFRVVNGPQGLQITDHTPSVSH